MTRSIIIRRQNGIVHGLEHSAEEPLRFRFDPGTGSGEHAQAPRLRVSQGERTYFDIAGGDAAEVMEALVAHLVSHDRVIIIEPEAKP